MNFRNYLSVLLSQTDHRVYSMKDMRFIVNKYGQSKERLGEFLLERALPKLKEMGEQAAEWRKDLIEKEEKSMASLMLKFKAYQKAKTDHDVL